MSSKEGAGTPAPSNSQCLLDLCAEEQWQCPYCGCEWVHFDEPHWHPSDSYTCPTGERGSWIDIPVWGECGHHWHVVVAFHKGQAFTHVVPGQQETGTVPLVPRARR